MEGAFDWITKKGRLIERVAFGRVGGFPVLTGRL